MSNAGFQNSNNLRADRSLSALDAPHRLVINGLYALPFGAGRRFNPKGVARAKSPQGHSKNLQLVPADYVRKCGRPSPYNPYFDYSLQFDVNGVGGGEGCKKESAG